MTQNKDMCECCKQPNTYDGYCQWEGPPFSQRAVRELCVYCLNAIKPMVVKRDRDDMGIALVGTYSDNVYTLSEMLSEGFEKKRSSQSIRKVGAVVGLSAAKIKQRLNG